MVGDARTGGGRALSRRRDYDEDDVRVRPTRGSRPRTQRRPRHADAAAGLVIAVDRGRYTCLVGDRQVTAMKARELGRGSIVVGDRVRLVGDLSGRPDTLARVVRVDRRTSVLRRTADDTDPVERVIVANADQMVIVTSLAEPAPQPRLIDRCLVAADDAELRALLCITKGDLRDPAGLLGAYAGAGARAVVTARRPDRTISGLDELRAELSDRSSVFVGSSGVGKSTLVNALVPDAGRAVGTVNPVTGRGRHTSTSAVALPLAEGGWIIDTPGVRSFGLAHVPAEDLIAAFPDLVPGTADCPPGCTHLEEGCALDAWVAAGHAPAERLDSLRRLLRSRDAEA